MAAVAVAVLALSFRMNALFFGAFNPVQTDGELALGLVAVKATNTWVAPMSLFCFLMLPSAAGMGLAAVNSSQLDLPMALPRQAW